LLHVTDYDTYKHLAHMMPTSCVMR